MTIDRRNDAPDSINQSQREKGQAQDIARDAREQRPDLTGETERSSNEDPAQIIPADKQDVVDHMQQMGKSGQIDQSAFAGERNDDDEESPMGILDEAVDDAPLSEKGGADFGNSG